MPTLYVAKHLGAQHGATHPGASHCDVTHYGAPRYKAAVHKYSYTSWHSAELLYIFAHTGLLSSQKEVYQMLLTLLKQYQCTNVTPSAKWNEIPGKENFTLTEKTRNCNISAENLPFQTVSYHINRKKIHRDVNLVQRKIISYLILHKLLYYCWDDPFY